jgi:hypothetical protein
MTGFSDRAGRKRVGTVGALAVLMAVAAGCTGTEPEATPGAPAGGSPESSSAPITVGSTRTVNIPPRPKELRLDGIQPCSLFTRAQLTQLKVSREPRSRTTTSVIDAFVAPECVLSVDADGKFYDYSLRAITKEGIEPWLAGKRLVVAELVSIGGYPAATFHHSGSGSAQFNCYTAVDVAEGQQLILTMQPISRGFGEEQMCQLAEEAAGLALQTLQTLK